VLLSVSQPNSLTITTT